MKSFRDLSLSNKMSVLLLYTRINMRIVFGLKAVIFLLVAVLYVAALCVISMTSDDGISIGPALRLIVWLPLTIFAVLFSMDIISRERDANLIETLFTVSVSVYRLWIIKFVTLMLSLGILAAVLIAVTDFFVIDLPLMLTWISVMPPILFFASFTVLLSAMFKSANAAGLCVTAILAFVVLITEGASSTVIYPYLNPFDKPEEREVFIWVRAVVYNKIAYTLLGCVSFWRALRWLDRREWLLK